jgi:hypothetical protein
MEKRGTDREAIDGNIIRSMRLACWINKATDTHSQYVYLRVHTGAGGVKPDKTSKA